MSNPPTSQPPPAGDERPGEPETASAPAGDGAPSDPPAAAAEPGASGDAAAGATPPGAAGDAAAEPPPDIPIEVETSPSGNGASAGGATGDEIAVEVDTEGEAAERLAALEADNARLTARVAELDQEKAENWERFLRARADLDNFRKRAKRDVDNTRVESRGKVLKEMLEVIDSLERAVEHGEAGGDPEKIYTGMVEGVKLVLRQFAQALERFEVKPIDAIGQPFDPNLHEAISQQETAEHAPGSVVFAPKKGYTIGERLLRPALVVVAKAPPEPPAPEPAADAGAENPDQAGDPAADDADGAAAEPDRAGTGDEA